MNNNPRLEPANQKNLINELHPEKTEAELEADLEHILSPEAIFNFVRLHYMRDDGNDTPPSGAELEESFRSYISKLGYKGPKVEMFIQRAMTSIDDYDYTDKFDNTDQILGSSYGKRVFVNEIDHSSNTILTTIEPEQKFSELGGTSLNNKNKQEPTFREKHKNNPFYIDPFSPPKPF